MRDLFWAVSVPDSNYAKPGIMFVNPAQIVKVYEDPNGDDTTWITVTSGTAIHTDEKFSEFRKWHHSLDASAATEAN